MPKSQNNMHMHEEVVEKRDHLTKITRLQLQFLLPLAAAIFSIVGVLILVIHWYQHKIVDDNVIRIRYSAQEFYDKSINQDVNSLQAIMAALKSNSELKVALESGDRQQQLVHSKAIFDELKHHFSITHFYFTDTSRVNMLRVHMPSRYGDRIDRTTTLTAEKSGLTSYGVELGPLGTFTLRLVSPWYDKTKQRLIGYVEIGKEIDQVLDGLREFFSAKLYVLTYKSRLNRESWEKGMRAMGGIPNWDMLQNMVLSSKKEIKIPSMVSDLLNAEKLPEHSFSWTDETNVTYRAFFLPLKDVAGNIVAQMMMVVDVSQDLNKKNQTIYIASFFTVVTGFILFVLFYLRVDKIGRKINENERRLRDFAIYDQLTGIYNRRHFAELMAIEMNRSRRYDFPVSLIMFDIDHFKKVNDVWGHQAGDDVLSGLVTYIKANIRNIDFLARWGGEEFMLILSNSDIENARVVAEKLRVLVEQCEFGNVGKITCSFGVTQFKSNDKEEDIVSRADAALYMAKKTGRNRVCIDKGTGNVE